MMKNLAMITEHDTQDLLDHLCRSAAIEPEKAQQLLREMLHFYNETSNEFMQRRHLELQQQGMNNEEIYTTIQTEVAQRRFAAPAITTRQIRRVIYG